MKFQWSGRTWEMISLDSKTSKFLYLEILDSYLQYLEKVSSSRNFPATICLRRSTDKPQVILSLPLPLLSDKDTHSVLGPMDLRVSREEAIRLLSIWSRRIRLSLERTQQGRNLINSSETSYLTPRSLARIQARRSSVLKTTKKSGS